MNLDNITYFSSNEECYELLSAWKIAAKKNIESKKLYYVPSEKELYECRVIGYSEYLTIQVLIIEVNNEIHKVLAAFFKEMQRTAKQLLDLQAGGSI